ncbi:MAG: hypothetical protein E6G92_07140 [Alphaproteobacteria bacterium]|nr:MAG: hypothetical protein E6G92_07140 [Alphaproteobacteria bacterium]
MNCCEIDWSRIEWGTAADWVSGTGSLLAVIVALGGYWLIERHRKRDETQRHQDAAYQIGYKLASLSSEAHNLVIELNPHGKSDDDLAAESDMDICGGFSAQAGSSESLIRDLNDAEQNLLMRLKEEDFLMTFSEAVALGLSLRAGLAEYKAKREALMAMLPPPVDVSGEMAGHDLTQQQILSLQPQMIQAASLVRSLRALATINVKRLRKLGVDFRPMMLRHFPKLHIHEIQIVKDTAH